MKKLLVFLAACGAGSKPVAPPPPEQPVATRGPDKTEPPPDAADRKHAFTRTLDQLPWEGNTAVVGPDQLMMKVTAGSSFDVTGGAAVVVAERSRTRRASRSYAWANKSHRIECVKGADCLVFLDKSVKLDALEQTKLEWSRAGSRA